MFPGRADADRPAGGKEFDTVCASRRACGVPKLAEAQLHRSWGLRLRRAMSESGLRLIWRSLRGGPGCCRGGAV